jgi:hypothetical protein
MSGRLISGGDSTFRRNTCWALVLRRGLQTVVSFPMLESLKCRSNVQKRL